MIECQRQLERQAQDDFLVDVISICWGYFQYYLFLQGQTLELELFNKICKRETV